MKGTISNEVTFPLQIKLLCSIQSLLFKQGYTIRNDPDTEGTQGEGDSLERLLWSGGLSSVGVVPNTSLDTQYFKPRYYLMLLLVVCCSSDLSQDSDNGDTPDPLHNDNPSLAFMTHKKNPMIKTLVFSLLNSVLTYDCDGYKVPYANHIQQNRYVDSFFKQCLELLLVLVQYNPT